MLSEKDMYYPFLKLKIHLSGIESLALEDSSTAGNLAGRLDAVCPLYICSQLNSKFGGKVER